MPALAVSVRSSREALSRAQIRTLVVLWTTYGSFYFCRVNPSAARTTIQHQLGMSALEIGLWETLCAELSKLRIPEKLGVTEAPRDPGLDRGLDQAVPPQATPAANPPNPGAHHAD